MKLNGRQFEAIAQALLDAFNPASLEAMVRIQLDERLNQISVAGSMAVVVYNLIQWAEAHDRVQELVDGACLANPENGKLRTLQARSQAEQWFGSPPPGSDMMGRSTSSTLPPATGKAPDEPGKPVGAPAAQLFFSYAHKDEELRDRLETHLASLKRQGVISGWHDRQIQPGTEWAGQIDEHIHSAQIILLLVSADFLASDYCYDLEMKRAMARHEAGEARVIPVILRPCDWQTAPFAKLQALPKDGRPITSWANRDEAFLSVTQGIRAALGAYPSSSGDPAVAKSAPSRASPGDERRDAQRVVHVANSSMQRANLRNILAELYPDEASARRVVADAGLDARRIAFSSQATNNWQAILSEAEKSDQVDALLALILGEYSSNEQLVSALNLYRMGRRAPR